MPRKTASRLELRKQAEAAEKSAPKKAKKKKAAKKRSTRRTKDSTPERKRLVWVIYTATLREEARFNYDQRKEAEEKLATLQAKGKRTYFLQPVKELISGTAPAVEEEAPEDVKEVAEEDLIETTETEEVEEPDLEESEDLELDEFEGDDESFDDDEMPADDED